MSENPLWQLMYDSEADVTARLTIASDHAEEAMKIATDMLAVNFPGLVWQPVGIAPEGEDCYTVSFTRVPQ